MSKIILIHFLSKSHSLKRLVILYVIIIIILKGVIMLLILKYIFFSIITLGFYPLYFLLSRTEKSIELQTEILMELRELNKNKIHISALNK